MPVAPCSSPQTLAQRPDYKLLATAGVLGATALAYMWSRQREPRVDSSLWGSNELPDGSRCNKLVTPSKLTEDFEGAQTVYEGFLRGLKLKGSAGNCLGRLEGKRYVWLSYEEVHNNAKSLGAGLLQSGHTKTDFVGIYSSNRPEWSTTELMTSAYGMVIVPLYDTLGADSCVYILNQTEMPTVVCDTEARVLKLLCAVEETPHLKRIVFLEPVSEDTQKVAELAKITLISFDSLIVLGKSKPMPVTPAKPDDLLSIQYTSGTTGFPKGVMLTHKNIVCVAWTTGTCFSAICDSPIELLPKDSTLLYLPLAHSYAQLTQIWFWCVGGEVAFLNGPVTELANQCQILKPTFLPLVPRLMNRVYSKVCGDTKSGLKGKLFWYAYAKKRELFLQGYVTRSSIWDKLVFSKLQKLLGGNIRAMSTGSAPISREVLEFFRVSFGAYLVEGYGQTESGAVATCALDETGGTVGHPITCNLIKLVDVPSMNYYSADRKGEICIKGPNVMKGYYKQPEKTAETIDPDGWLHTGDVGTFLEDGSLKIIDRLKHIFKLSQGEYIAPEKVENVYAQVNGIAQIFIDGDSTHHFTVGVAVPDEVYMRQWAKENGHSADASMRQICDDQKFVITILKNLRAHGSANKLNGLEQIKALHLHDEQFTPENGLLTPSMKSKRPELRSKFAPQFAAIYAAGEML